MSFFGHFLLTNNLPMELRQFIFRGKVYRITDIHSVEYRSSLDNKTHVLMLKMNNPKTEYVLHTSGSVHELMQITLWISEFLNGQYACVAGDLQDFVLYVVPNLLEKRT